ncbi:hypothetical protein [Edaphosphingomonas haloaromaticamans]|nr:hypothetical protein [Sphingomonas haloaromaticamans]
MIAVIPASRCGRRQARAGIPQGAGTEGIMFRMLDIHRHSGGDIRKNGG